MTPVEGRCVRSDPLESVSILKENGGTRVGTLPLLSQRVVPTTVLRCEEVPRGSISYLTSGVKLLDVETTFGVRLP